MIRRWLVGGAVLVAGAAALGLNPPALDAVAPNPETQRALAAVAAASSEEGLNGPLIVLKATGGEDFRDLVPQLLYFSMRATDVRDGMAAAVVVDRLGITPQQQLRAAAPYLNTRDAALQRELRNLFGSIDGASASRAADFTPFAPLLRERVDDPPVVLIAYMMDTAPDQALAMLAATYIRDPDARRAVLSGPRTAADLEHLAEHDAWWVRLYVAERVAQDPRLQTPALMQRLRDDSHPSVRAAASRPVS
ncbi:MAG: hypothetical protein ACRERC_06015 [Candidatus Binatia bacterium]